MEKILIVGGTNFIGRNLIERLIALNQFEITVFTRGKTNPDLFPQINKIRGDRKTNYIQLISGQKWDYIIDCSCYYPDSIDKLLDSISGIVKRYILISTVSVYDNESDKSVLRNEEAIILDCTKEEGRDTTMDTYGERKAECERRLQKSNQPYYILRPSLVYGKYDYTDRFYYWLYQIKKTNEVLVPNNGEQPFAVTYVDDLINCIIESINKEGESDIYNVVSNSMLSIAQILDGATTMLERDPPRYFASSTFLKREEISEWIDLPLWLDCDHFTYGNSKLLANFDLQITDFNTSLERTIDYYDQLDWPVPKFGLMEQRKQELINKLKG
ncbi:MAG: 2'-hydroxyisoflavone reductase [Saprospiraceae bacterium]|jgi:2'-hydroxyisoflavone reductase